MTNGWEAARLAHMRLNSPRTHRIIAKRAAIHRAVRVDAVNTFRVSAGRFACFPMRR